MDAQSFGLSRDPFGRSPDLDDTCLPNTVAALLSELQSGLRSPQGISVLVAPSSSGKSLAAAAFARRLGGASQVALLSQPFSSVSAIARDALSAADPSAINYATDEDWARAFRACVSRRADAGRGTVILLDNAHALSSQTLEALPSLFGDDETLPLHFVLFGRPELLDRMHSGPERTLHAHLLQICRLKPLGVRESVRYLERRVSISGGELGAFFSAEAIEAVVQRAEGRVVALEEVASESWERAAARGALRVTVEDVGAVTPGVAAEEEEDMATRQQRLPFRLSSEQRSSNNDDWGIGDEEEQGLEWGDEPEEDADEWRADDRDTEELESDGDDEESSGVWETSDEDTDEDSYEDPDASDGELDVSYEGGRAAVLPTMRRRLVGPAILSLTACLGLVWIANNLPGGGEDEVHGRDSQMATAPLSSTPETIMRVAQSAQLADANAQVEAWLAQPPKPMPVVAPASAGTGDESVVAQAGDDVLGDPTAKRAASPEPAVAAEIQGPAEPIEAAAVPTASPAAEKVVAKKTTPVVASAKKAPVAAKVASKSAAKAASTNVASAKRSGGGSVYTVQLGAFKARRNAEDLATKLRGKSPRIIQEGGLYRVVSGSFSSKRDATVHEASLRRAGYSTYVRTAVF